MKVHLSTLTKKELNKLSRYIETEDGEIENGRNIREQQRREGTFSNSEKNQERIENTQRSGVHDYRSDRHDGETSEIQRLDSEQDAKRSSQYYGDRDNEYGFEDIHDIKSDITNEFEYNKIEDGEKPSSEGVNNVLVFAKGTIDNPVITSVIQVFEYDETALADIRRYIYGLERRGISTKSGQVIQRYYTFDFADGYKSKNIENSRDNNDNRYGRGYSEGTFKAEKGNVSLSFKDGEEKTTYTEQEYQAFGWTRENEILNSGQNADYRSKFAMAESGQAKFQKSKNGEYIIPVSNIYDSTFEGVNNVLVFVKGTIDNPVITSVIEIFEYDETEIDKVRRHIYALERRGIHPEIRGVIRRHYASDFTVQQQGAVLQDSRNNNDNRYGRGYSEGTSKVEKGNVSLSPEDSKTTEYNKIEDGEKPSSLNATDVNLSIRKGSRAEKAQTQNIIDSSEILYVDPNKERTTNWLTLNRLQLPLNITNYGPLKSITYSHEDVNIYGIPTAENNYKKLWVVTSYISKNKEDITQVLHDELSALGTTSETPLASLSSDKTIPYIDGAVNIYDMPNAENNAVEKELNFAREMAVGVEVHNRNSEGYKPDPNLKEMYVLVSAFEDGESIIPVKLEIKEFSDKANKLYVAIALENIKKNEVVKEGNTKNSVTQASRSFNISVSQLLRNINPYIEKFRGLARDLAELKSAGSAIGVNTTSNMEQIKKEYAESVDKDMVAFAENAIKNTDDNKSAYKMKDVSKRASNDIKRLTGIDTTDFGTEAKASAFRHIDNRHGTGGINDSSMKDINDVARMQYVIDNYDDIELLESRSKEFRDKGQNPAPLVRYKKRINGNYYLIEAIPDTQKQTVEVVTAYIEKAVSQEPNAESKNSPSAHVQNDTNFTAKSSIANDNGIVNSDTQIRQVDNPDLNGFIEYLNDFANDLAGKTGGLDRAVIKSMGGAGRKVIIKTPEADSLRGLFYLIT